MIRALDVSPDGKYVRVTRMTKPFSYIVPASNFGSVEEVWDLEGKVLAKVTDRALNLGAQDDTQPPDPAAGPGGGGAAQQGRREIAWREDGQGLTFLEQELPPVADIAPGAGARAGGERRDRRAGRAAWRRPGHRRPRPRRSAAQGPPVPVAPALR